jgi:hypothetical protein
MTVAALYVDPRGVYANLPDVEVWDEARDARLYAGPWPVVAHPPCNRWSIMANCRPGLRDGDDGGCFEHALWAVREFGGVLEHPAYSLAWDRFALPEPTRYGWTTSLTDDGFTTEVDQGRYGARTRKLTWLYVVGEPAPLLWGDGGNQDTSVRWLGHGRSSGTPESFRDVLLSMARSAHPLDVKAPDDIASGAC